MIYIEMPPQPAVAIERHAIVPPDYPVRNLIGTSSSTWSLYQATSCTTKRRAMQTDMGSFSDEATSRLEMTERVRQYTRDINNMWEPYTMSKEEVTYFQNERSAALVPLAPDQMRVLPSRKR